MEIVVKHLCKSFGGRTVLRDLTFTAGPGITAVMAPSGTGKTTLLRILLGLERPDSGTVEGLAGKRLTAVFQEDRLLEHLSAEGNLRFVLGRAYDPAAARALLDRLTQGRSRCGSSPAA
ncbi:ATP-binding cassette domain-containing protein [Dysosmobacter welbionis]|uniref:ATP-binding cassette domain-containing protein n=1 Tax=Dysosmobacter welbionis TaxID=2093857 RepID=UPI0029437B0B|nr:ATP-binding cassette domain-containing protein [Dysosmobacter welbionis]